ncbi:MAG: peptidase dimerization domain-containing protein, partial [Vicinamibacterales bacterium]
MQMPFTRIIATSLCIIASTAQAQDARLERLKAEAATKVEARAKLVQEIIDQVFSFGELGMQEVETSKYLTGLLEKNGFKIERGIAGIPTAWTATFGSGKPVIALGSDIDGIPQSNQKPGVGYRDAIVGMAPGHGEGHNSGQAVNIAAALVVKEIMERERIPGTLVLWPGVAEEQAATKAHYVRAGVFKDTDINLFTHVGNNLGVSWGQSGSNALLSVIFKFRGQTAHSAGAPWRGKSALDAVVLMAQAWEMKREHLELPQRSHYVIPDGGDQPNVVPQTASIWFYLRERDYARTMAMFEAAKKMAQGAALMTDTQVDSINIVGSAWSGHFNKTIAEVTFANIRKVGLPKWEDADIALAKGIQKELGSREAGLETSIDSLGGPVNEATRMGGGSDDIGDISWNMPTVTLRFPSNIPSLP